MTEYEKYWDLLLLTLHNPAVVEMLENTHSTHTIVSKDYIEWAEEL